MKSLILAKVSLLKFQITKLPIFLEVSLEYFKLNIFKREESSLPYGHLLLAPSFKGWHPPHVKPETWKPITSHIQLVTKS